MDYTTASHVCDPKFFDQASAAGAGLLFAGAKEQFSPQRERRIIIVRGCNCLRRGTRVLTLVMLASGKVGRPRSSRTTTMADRATQIGCERAPSQRYRRLVRP